MASQPHPPVHAAALAHVAARAHFLLSDGQLTVRLVDGDGRRLAVLCPDAAALERFAHAALSMAEAARQVQANPALQAGRTIPLFTAVRLNPAAPAPAGDPA